jgi:hypothetical protein
MLNSGDILEKPEAEIGKKTVYDKLLKWWKSDQANAIEAGNVSDLAQECNPCIINCSWAGQVF